MHIAGNQIRTALGGAYTGSMPREESARVCMELGADYSTHHQERLKALRLELSNGAELPCTVLNSPTDFRAVKRDFGPDAVAAAVRKHRNKRVRSVGTSNDTSSSGDGDPADDSEGGGA